MFAVIAAEFEERHWSESGERLSGFRYWQSADANGTADGDGVSGGIEGTSLLIDGEHDDGIGVLVFGKEPASRVLDEEIAGFAAAGVFVFDPSEQSGGFIDGIGSDGFVSAVAYVEKLA